MRDFVRPYVRDGAVDILQEDGATTNVFENGGFTLDPPARKDRPDAPPFDYNARLEVNRQSLREYNAAIDAWIEREARLSPSPFETVKASEMPFLLSVVRMVSQGVRREAMQKAAGGSSDLADKVSTPLGNAAPLEYSERTAGNDAFSMAARGVSEAQEAGAFASMRLTCSDALAVQMGGARMATSCRQNAFDRYRQCRGY